MNAPRATITYVGFGRYGGIAYIVRDARTGREIGEATAGPENKADEKPRGFFAALGNLYRATGAKK